MICSNSRAAALGVSLAGIAFAAGARPANATLFSFAANTNANAYTLSGTGSGGAGGNSFTISDFSRPNTYTLLIDDDNGPMPTISLPVELRLSLTATNGQAITITPNVLYQHVYRVTGTFGFYDMMGNALLTAQVGNSGDTTGASGGVLTVPGSQSAWSTAGAIVGNDASSVLSYTFSQALINALGGDTTASRYGLTVGSTTSTGMGENNFGFTMSNVNSGTVGAAVGIDQGSQVPTGTWQADSSFSGSTGVVPAPASAALLGLGMLVTRRRRR